MKISLRIDSEKAQTFLSVADPEIEHGANGRKTEQHHNENGVFDYTEGYGAAVVGNETIDAEAKLRLHLRTKKKLQREMLQQNKAKLESDNMTEISNHETRSGRLAENVDRENALKAILEQRGRK